MNRDEHVNDGEFETPTARSQLLLCVLLLHMLSNKARWFRVFPKGCTYPLSRGDGRHRVWRDAWWCWAARTS